MIFHNLLPVNVLVWVFNIAIGSFVVTATSLLVVGIAKRRSCPLKHAVLFSASVLLLVAPMLAWFGTTSKFGLLTWSHQETIVAENDALKPSGDMYPAKQNYEVSPEPTPPITSGQKNSLSKSTDGKEIVTTEKVVAENEKQVALPLSKAGSAPKALDRVSSESDSVLRIAAELLVAVWLLGSLVALTRLWSGLWRLRQLKQSCEPCLNEEVQELAAGAADHVGLTASHELCCSPSIPVPVSFGLFRPTVVLPTDFHNVFSREEMSSILQHEMAHLVRRDSWTGLLQRLVLLSYWWNPLVYLVARKLTDVRESICDNFVMRSGSGHALASAILKSAERVASLPALPMVSGFGESSDLEQRFEELTKPERDTSTRITVRSVPFLILLNVIIVVSMLGFAIRSVAEAEESVAGSGRDKKSEVEVLRFDRMDEIERIMIMLAEKTRSNFESIKTLKLEGTYVHEETHASADGDTDNQMLMRRVTKISTVFDSTKNAIKSVWEDTEPVTQEEIATGIKRYVKNQRVCLTSILTEDHWLRFGESFNFEAKTAADALKYIYVEPISTERDFDRWPLERARNSWEASDPRIAFQGIDSSREYLWDSLKRSQGLGKIVEEETDQERINSLKKHLWIERTIEDGRQLIAVKRRFRSGGRDYPASIYTTLHDERFGFNAVESSRSTQETESSKPQSGNKMTVEYVSRDGIFVPAVIYRKSYNELDVYQFTKIAVNEKSDVEFSLASLGIREGEVVDDRGADAIRVNDGVFNDGELAELVEFNRPSTPNVSVHMSPRAFATNQWNTLLHRYLECSNGLRDSDDPALATQLREVANRLVELAKNEHTSDGTAFMALEMVLQDEHAAPVNHEAAELLCERFIGNEEFDQHLYGLCRQLGFGPDISIESEYVLRRVIKNYDDPKLVGTALLSLGNFLRKYAEKARTLAALPSREESLAREYGMRYVEKLQKFDPAAMEREAEQVLNRVVSDPTYADIPFSGDASTGALAEKELKRLRVTTGQRAIEFAGTDLQDKALRLSDYDGKVRVLYFWGHWCPSCKKQYPRHRALIEKHRDDEFAFIGISSDARKETLLELAKSGDVTWPAIWDGYKKPWPIHTEWGLTGSPWNVVLDRTGKVRYRNLNADELEEAVDLLLDE